MILNQVGSDSRHSMAYKIMNRDASSVKQECNIDWQYVSPPPFIVESNIKKHQYHALICLPYLDGTRMNRLDTTLEYYVTSYFSHACSLISFNSHHPWGRFVIQNQSDSKWHRHQPITFVIYRVSFVLFNSLNHITSLVFQQLNKVMW